MKTETIALNLRGIAHTYEVDPLPAEHRIMEPLFFRQPAFFFIPLPGVSSVLLAPVKTRIQQASLQIPASPLCHRAGYGYWYSSPGQEEIAAVLKSWFTLDGVTNQINYLRKKPAGEERAEEAPGLSRLCVRINLMSGPPRNSLARTGYFIRPIAEGVLGIRKHAKAMLGAAPSEDDVARSLKSSFILSEIKNQIVHASKGGR